MLKKIFLIFFILISFRLFGQNNLFLYIPTDEEIQDLFGMRSYLKDWNDNKITVDDLRFEALFNNYLGDDSVHSLLFESFLRYTKNSRIQNRVLKYIKDNNINTNFTKTLEKLYAARRTSRRVDGKNVIQYVYQNNEYDENINLFWFDEAYFYEGEFGLLLFENDWGVISFDGKNDPNNNFFTLIFGGGTNSMTITFQKYTNMGTSKNY